MWLVLEALHSVLPSGRCVLCLPVHQCGKGYHDLSHLLAFLSQEQSNNTSLTCLPTPVLLAWFSADFRLGCWQTGLLLPKLLLKYERLQFLSLMPSNYQSSSMKGSPLHIFPLPFSPLNTQLRHHLHLGGSWDHLT